jgi:hypothetical protein
VLQANRLYVSLDRGHSFAYHHALDVWGDYPNSTDHANQAFAVAGGEGHFAFRTADGCVTYRHAEGLDGPQASWGKPECVRATNDSRIDFPQIALGPGGIPTLGYGVGDPNLGAAQAWAATSTRLLPP